MNRAVLSTICLIIGCQLYAAEPATQDTPAAPDAKAEFLDAYHTYQQLRGEGKHAQALPYAQRAYQLGSQLYGENHRSTAALALNLGETLDANGQHKEAIPVIDTAIGLYERAYGNDAREVIDPLMARGNAASAWDAKEKADYYDRAIAIAHTYVKADDLLLARLNLEAGVQLSKDGNVNASKRYLDAAYAQYRKQVPATDSRLVITSFWLGKYFLATEKPSTAEPYFNQVLAAFDSESAPVNPLAKASHTLLVGVYEQLGDPAQATPHCIAVGRLVPWDGQTEPAPLYRKELAYPAEAKGRDGFALIEFTIDASGFVRDPKLLKTEGSDSFGEPGLAAIGTWRYAPRFVDGSPVDTAGVQTKVEFKFTPERPVE